jgi:hypothetical protein
VPLGQDVPTCTTLYGRAQGRTRTAPEVSEVASLIARVSAADSTQAGSVAQRQSGPVALTARLNVVLAVVVVVDAVDHDDTPTVLDRTCDRLGREVIVRL